MAQRFDKDLLCDPPVFGHDNQIVDIALDYFMEHIIKDDLDCPLVSCSYIL